MVRIGDENCTARTSFYLARVALYDGDHNQASTYLRDSIQMYQKLNRGTYISMCLNRYAELAETTGQHRRAARLLGAAKSLLPESIAAIPIFAQADLYGHVEEVRRLLEDDDFDRAYKEGSRMTLDEAVAYALGESGGYG
jgi:ATP/maltotriose-dependent transcriptional regulator MalT